MNKNFTKRYKAGQYMAGVALFAFALQMPQTAFAVPVTVTWQQQAQDVLTVSGTILDDADGQPLPGATIMDGQRKVLGTTNGNGAFTVKIAKGSTLTGNHVGLLYGKQSDQPKSVAVNFPLKGSVKRIK